MSLLKAGACDVRPYHLPQLATQIRVVEFVPGLLVKITDINHPNVGQVGTLEFTRDSRSWLQIGSQMIEAPLTALSVVDPKFTHH